MDSTEIFITALKYEEKIRDLYLSAVDIVDDERGKTLFKALADDEQLHIDFLNYSLDTLKADGIIEVARLETPIPSQEQIRSQVETMKAKIPEKMLGDVKRVLNSALQMEIETSAYYQDASEKTEGKIKEILEKFVEIEDRHVEVVQIELDYASKSGHWFNFMEVSMEVE
ncbi:MAG: rubrerythrin [Desulfobulbaceae bacterium C00003063]|nr:MAG: rubrerythrin [Desulfobulbaceae bacterium C00003063]